MRDDRTNVESQALPGADLDPAKAPGHWVLARMGKRILRPGGRELTDKLVAGLRVTPKDRIVEFAPGLGMTTAMMLEHQPAAYTAVERDADAAERVRAVLQPHGHSCVTAGAQDNGLPAESATVVFGEAYLTMQPHARKQDIVREAYRLLAPGGRFALHEMALTPDSLDHGVQEAVRADLASTLRVGARPLTAEDWKRLLVDAGFRVREEAYVPMGLLTPRRIIRDEGFGRAVRFVINVLRTKEARERVLAMRAMFRRQRGHLSAIMLIAEKPPAT